MITTTIPLYSSLSFKAIMFGSCNNVSVTVCTYEIFNIQLSKHIVYFRTFLCSSYYTLWSVLWIILWYQTFGCYWGKNCNEVRYMQGAIPKPFHSSSTYLGRDHEGSSFIWEDQIILTPVTYMPLKRKSIVKIQVNRGSMPVWVISRLIRINLS